MINGTMALEKLEHKIDPLDKNRPSQASHSNSTTNSETISPINSNKAVSNTLTIFFNNTERFSINNYFYSLNGQEFKNIIQKSLNTINE